jgi:hypothetical protein
MVINALCGGTITEVSGGTIAAVWGGTIMAVWGGTITAVSGGFDGYLGKITKPGKVVDDQRKRARSERL